MDIRYLRFFIAVAEEGNFRRAAERLHTAQPSLSHQIKRLEKIVGARLLVRDKHRTHLTAAGKAFLKRSYTLLENLEAAIEEACTAARTEEGSLTIGYVTGTELLIFPRVLPTLHDRFPGMNFRLITGYPTQLVDSLQNGILDCAFSFQINSPTIDSQVVGRMPLVVVLPASHPLAALNRIPPAELVKYPLIAPTAGNFPEAWELFKSIATQAGEVFRPIAEVDNSLAVMNAVQSGLGISIVPECITPTSPNVLIRRLDIEPPPWPDLCLSYRNDSSVPREILQVLLECLREKP